MIPDKGLLRRVDSVAVSDSVILVVQEAPQLPAPARVLQLAQSLGLDLAYALTGYAELLADLLERVIGVHADAEAHAQHALLARGKRSQHARGRLPQIGLNGSVDGQHRIAIFDKITQVRILLIADGRLQ